MFVKICRLATVLLVGLSMGPALGHLLEMPAKMGYDGSLWLRLLQTLYPPGFGTAGSVFEVSALLAAVILTVSVRRRRPAFAWTFVGALCILAAHAAFWIWVAPVNANLLPLTPETLPPHWKELRNQWEYTHAARAVLQAIALGFITISILVETPAHAERPKRA